MVYSNKRQSLIGLWTGTYLQIKRNLAELKMSVGSLLSHILSIEVTEQLKNKL